MTEYPSVLGRIGGVWCLGFSGSPNDIADRAYAWTKAGFTVRTVRGRKMRHYRSLFDEFAPALQFPWYFGENGNAFDECMMDLSWLLPGRGYLFLITEAAQTLIDTKDDGLTWLVRSLSSAANGWANPVELGQPSNPQPVPFHVVLQTDEHDKEITLAKWVSSGAVLEWLQIKN